MAVFIDDAFLPYGRMKMCHMIADSREELWIMADSIGIARKWIQNPLEWSEHLDVCMSKRKLALDAGAVPISYRELVVKAQKRDPDLRAKLEEMELKKKRGGV